MKVTALRNSQQGTVLILLKKLLKKLIKCYNCVALRCVIVQFKKPSFSTSVLSSNKARLIAVCIIYATPSFAANPETEEALPKLQSLIPTLPISLWGKGTLSISQQATHYQFGDDRVLVKANAGWGYLSQGSGVVGLDFAGLLGDSSAVGLNLNYQQDRVEAVLHHVKYWVPAGWRWKGAVSYLRGRQQFNFFRSSETARLSQLAYYGSVDWLDTGKLDLGLQSLGLASWGGKSKNHSQFNTLDYIDDTPAYFLITRDARQLSEGRLFGAALDFQYAAGTYLNWVFKGGSAEEPPEMTNLGIGYSPSK